MAETTDLTTGVPHPECSAREHSLHLHAPTRGAETAAVRDALRGALVQVDAGARLEVSWWRSTGRGGNVVADQRHPDDEGTPNPHEAATLAELGAELDRLRRERSPKRSNPALCGGVFAPADDDGRAVFLRRGEHLRAVSLVQVDVDGKPGDAVTLGAAVRALESLGVAALLHPSPSARGYLDAVKWRAWIRVAVDGHTSVPVRHRTGDINHAIHAALHAVTVASLDGANVDPSVWNGGAVGYTDRENDAAAGPCVVLRGAALDLYAARDALVAIGAAEPYTRGPEGSRNGETQLTMLRELSAHAPGVIGEHRPHGMYYIACPLAHTHSNQTGRGADSSCVLLVPTGLLKCSHQHQARGQLNGHTFVAAIAEQWPAFAPRAWALWGEASARRPADARAEVFAGSPGDTSDARVAWERAGDGAAVHVQSPRDAGENLAEDFRRTVTRWQNGDRTVRLRLDAVGTGKSTIAAAAVAALAPVLPGELDERRDTPRALGRYVVETGKAAQAIAQRIDAAGRGTGEGFTGREALFIAALRGRHARPVRAAQYLPLSAVSINGTRVRAPRDGDDDGGCAHACPHWKEAESMEARGIDARTSLCKFAGTDDPRALRLRLPVVQPGDGVTACPRSRERGGACVAEEPWHYLDGTSPQSGDPWVAVVTVAAAFASKETVEGALTIVDETERAADPRPETILPAHVDDESGARALLDVLRWERRDHVGPRPLESARAVFRGLLDMLRSEGVEALYREGVEAGDGERATTVEARVMWAVRKLDAWASSLDNRPSAQAVFNAWASMYDAAADVDPPASREELRARYVRKALLAFMHARPVVARWRRVRRGDSGSLDVGAEVWNALQAWLAGAPVHRHYTRDESGRRGEPSGGVAVLRWPPALVAARAWITRGPVVCLDATGDPAMVASALDIGGLSGVTGVRAIATELDGNPKVRRVMVTTDRATRRVLLVQGKRRGHASGDDDGARVRWHDPQGADAETLVRAVVATLRRDAPRRDGRIAPGVIVAPRPLALALRVLHESEAAVSSMGDALSVALVSRAVADAGGAPDAVRAAVAELQGVAVWWTWFGSDLARGSNEPHEGGARWCVTIGDGLTNPADAARRAALARRIGDDGKPDATAQQRRDAAAALAQAHGRVRAARLEGPALLLHVGDVRPFDWPAAVDGAAQATRDGAPEFITLAALRDSFRPAKTPTPAAQTAAPAPDPGPRVVAATGLPAPLADALAAGWSRARVARCCGAAERTVYRWCAGETAPGAEHMGALQVSLAAAVDATRAGYRALLLPGRRPADLVNGKHGSPGVVAMSQSIAGAAAAHAIREGLPVQAPQPLTAAVFGKGCEGLRAWAEGRAELHPAVVAALAAVLPAMTREWIGYGGTPGLARTGVREALARVRDRAQARARVSADGAAPAAAPGTDAGA